MKNKEGEHLEGQSKKLLTSSFKKASKMKKSYAMIMKPK